MRYRPLFRLWEEIELGFCFNCGHRFEHTVFDGAEIENGKVITCNKCGYRFKVKELDDMKERVE